MLAEREAGAYRRPGAVGLLDEEDDDFGALPLDEEDDEDDPIIGEDEE